MYIPNELPPEYQEINERSKAILRSIIDKLVVNSVKKTIVAQEQLFSKAGDSKLYFIEEGAVPLCREDRVIAFFDEGDILGLQHIGGMHACTIQTDFAIKVREYDAKSFLESVWVLPQAALLWTEYLSCQLNLLSIVLGAALKSESRVSPEVRTVESGTIIIQQGNEADNVYTLLEGACDVLVDGVKVGQVGPDEIFGAMAVAIEGPRTATVVANSRAVVMSVPKEKFMQLIECRPGTTLRLVQDLSRTIVDLNKRVVGDQCVRA